MVLFVEHIKKDDNISIENEGFVKYGNIFINWKFIDNRDSV